MSCFYIVGLRLSNRQKNAVHLQEIFTKFGCNIKVRLGLHETHDDFCSNEGVILLQVCGEKQQVQDMLAALNDIDGIRAELMDLN